MRQIRSAFAIVALICVPASSPGQGPASDGQEDLRIHVSVNLVQIDASVTDSHGVPVHDLTKTDFEILLDGEPQPITHFLHIQPPAAVREAPTQAAVMKSETPPPARLTADQVARVVVLFVDDISMAAQTVPEVRRGVEKTIREQIGPGDLVAIIRASAGLGALQDFTSDKRMLAKAVDQIRWNPAGRGQMTAYDEVGVDRASEMRRTGNAPNAIFGYQEDENYREQTFTVATLDSLRRVVHGMAGMPGRKSLIVLSDRLPISLREITQGPSQARSTTQFNNDSPIIERMRDCVDQAARNGVVIYAIDTRGLASLSPGAGDVIGESSTRAKLPAAGGTLESQSAPPGATSASSLPGDFVWATASDMRESHDHRQAGGYFLASQTGGLMIPESNDIAASIARVYADMRDYYLLGFSPPDDAFNRASDGRPIFRHVSVRVNRKGLQVRSRSGFYGTADEEQPHSDRAELRLASSLESPFGSSAVDLRLRSSFLSARTNEWLATVSLWVDAHNLTLEGPDYNRAGIIHLLVRTFGVNGAELEGGIDKFLRVSLDQDGYRRAMKYGLVYATTIAIKKPGPYQIRAALLDQGSGNIGTASQFLDVPKSDKRNIALSGLVFPAMLSKEDDITPASEPAAFAPGQQVPFAFEIIGGAGDKGFQATTLLFRDGALISKSGSKKIEISTKSLHGSVFAKSEVTIPPDAHPGDYEMQVEVSDGARAASQWAELTVGPH